MLSKLKSMLSFAPVVEFVDYEDGLLTVRSHKALSPKNTTVKMNTSTGTITALVLVESYDHNNKVYRLKPLETEVTLNKLDVERRENPRFPKVVRVTSPHFPDFSGTTEDISECGTRVTTTGPLEIAYDIQMKIELDDPELPPLDVYADVAWTAQRFDGNYQSGLRFQMLTPEKARVIRNYIRDRMAIEKKLHTLEE